MRKTVLKIFVALVTITSSLVLGHADDSTDSAYLDIDNNFGAFTPQSFFSNGESINLVSGNLSMQWKRASVPGRSGMELYLTHSLNAGPTEVIIEKFTRVFDNAVSHYIIPQHILSQRESDFYPEGSLDNISYYPNVINVPGLGQVKAIGEDSRVFASTNKITYDPETAGEDVAWAPFRGIVVFTDISPNRPTHSRQVFLVKAGGGLEAFNAQTGMSMSRNTQNLLMHDLLTDEDDSQDGWQDPLTNLQALKVLDKDSREYIFVRHVSGSLKYKARYVHRCGWFWARRNCYDDYDDLTGWKVDSFILREYSDGFGNKISTSTSWLTNGEIQTIALYHSSENPWKTIERRTSGNSEWWIAPNSSGNISWTIHRDEMGRTTDVTDPEGNITSFEYNYQNAFNAFPQIRRQGLDNLVDPTYFAQVRYPTGGAIRYEFFDALKFGEGFVKNVIVTEIPDLNDQNNVYQKYYGIINSGAIGENIAGASRTALTLEDGAKVNWTFDRILNQLLPRSKETTAGNQTIAEEYEWSTTSDSSAVNGIGRVTVKKDGKSYTSAANTYDEIGRLLSMLRQGESTTYSYLLAPVDIPHGKETTSANVANVLNQKNLVGQVSKKSAGETYNINYYYGSPDSCGKNIKLNLLQKFERNVGNATKTTKSFCYDDYGNITKETIGSKNLPGADLNIAYDAEGVFRTSSEHESKTTSFSYNSGRLASLITPSGTQTSYSYDQLGRLTKIDFGKGFTVTHSYSFKNDSNGVNNVKTTIHDATTGQDMVVNRYYDGLGFLIEENRNGSVKRYTYDSAKRLSSITFNDGKVVKFAYDGFGRMITKYLPGMDPINYSYSAISNETLWLGNMVEISTGNPARGYKKTYDLLGRLVSVSKSLGDKPPTTKYYYDNLSNISKIVSPSDLTIDNSINYADDTLTRTYSGGDKIEVKEANDLGLFTDIAALDSTGNSVDTKLTYNADLQVDGVEASLTGGAPLNNLSVSYGVAGTNSLGRIKTVNDYYGTTEFWYGESGSVEGVERKIDALNQKYPFYYDKDAFGNILSLRYPHGLAIHYILDEQRRVKEVRKDTPQGLKIAEISYYLDGNPERIKYANGVVTDYYYDAAGRVIEIRAYKGGTYHLDERYTYDSLGRKTSVTHLDGSRTVYSYDDFGELVSATYYRNEETSSYETQTYAYDNDGNRISYSDSTKTVSYEMEKDGSGNVISNKLKVVQQLSKDKNVLVETNFEYKLGAIVKQEERQNGKLVLEKNYSYDAERRLIGATVWDHKTGFKTETQYGYDYSGRREWKKTDGRTNFYVYGESLDPLVDVNDKGEVDAAYIFIGGRRLAAIKNDKISIFHADELDNTLKITDESGEAAQTVRYDPFGNVNFLNGPEDNSYLFAGKPYDQATGLIYFGARYYDPGLGRYLSLDPLAQGTNHYTYTDNNPLVRRDIFGLWGMDGGGWEGGYSGFEPPSFGEMMSGQGSSPIANAWAGIIVNFVVSAVNFFTGTSFGSVDVGSMVFGMGGEGAEKKKTNVCFNFFGASTCKQSYNNYWNTRPVDISEGRFPPATNRIETSNTGHTSESHKEENGGKGGEPPAPDSDKVDDLPDSRSTYEQIINYIQHSFSENLVPPANNSGSSPPPIFEPPPVLDPPSHNFKPSGGGASDTIGIGLPPPDPAGKTKWQQATEFVTKPGNVGGFSEKQDKAGSQVQQDHTRNNTKDDINRAGDPVLLHSGDLVQSEGDLQIPGKGLNYEFRRTYRSRIIFNGPLGSNWDHNFNKRLVELENGNVARYEGNARFDVYTKNSDGSYTTPPGYFDILMKLGDGSFWIRDRNGTIGLYENDGSIKSITDSNGNALTFIHSTIEGAKLLSKVIDTTGREISYEYEGGRIKEVRDFTGRRVSFSYDSNGDLIRVAGPAKTTSYTYSSGFADDRKELNHNLLSATDGKGATYLYNEYSILDRVVRQRFGAEGWFEFEYRKIAADLECNKESEIGEVLYRTRVKDRSGNLTVHDFNCQGNPLKVEEFTRSMRTGDPESFVTKYAYNIDGLVTKTILPEGNSIEFTYETPAVSSPSIKKWSSGNLVEMRRIPDAARGGGAPLVTKLSYEPLYNKPVRIIDPRGSAEPEKFSTNIWYEYQEGLSLSQAAGALGIDEQSASQLFSGIGLSLGDINGDGAQSIGGSQPIVVQKPSAYDYDGVKQELIKRFHYNNSGQVVKVIDEAGVANKYDYDANGFKKSETIDPQGLNVTRSVVNDDLGRALSFTDANGNTSHFSYNDAGKVLETTNAIGAKTRYEYDANGNPVKIDRQNLDDNGGVIGGNEWLTTTIEYNILDRPVVKKAEISEGTFATTEFQYDLNENLARKIAPEGNSIFIEYDERDLAYKITRGFGTKDAATETIIYDGNKNIVSVTDAMGNISQFTYDGFDRNVSQEDALALRTNYTRDLLGRVTQIEKLRSELLSKKTFVYDEAGRIIESSEATRTHRYKYNSTDKLVSVLDPLGNVTRFEYDSMGRQIHLYDPAGNERVYSYDGNGRVLSVNERDYHEALGLRDNITNQEYDPHGRLIKKTDNAGHAWRYRYDSVGNLIGASDPLDVAGIDSGANAGNGNTTRFEYDGLGRTLKKIDELRAGGAGNGAVIDTATTQFKWDDNSRLISATDANGNESKFAYNSLNRRTSMALPDGKAYTTTYDKNSRAKTFKMPNGFDVEFDYDARGNLVKRSLSQNGARAGEDRFAYDELGRLITSKSFDAGGTLKSEISSAYNVFGEETISSQQGRDITRTYNLAGHVSTVAYPADASLSFTRDAIGRIKNIQDTSLGIAASLEYAGVDKKSRVEFGSGAAGSFAYNDIDRLTGFNWAKTSGAKITDHKLSYDKAGNVLLDELINEGNKQNTYGYDSIYRLVSAELETQGSQFEYDYDRVLNFTKVTERQENPSQTTEKVFNANALNQYTADSLVYDANGNLVQDENFNYTYNWRNQITEVSKVSDGTLVARYDYDALGRRTKKLNAASGEETRFIYDGWQLIEEDDASGNVIASYIYIYSAFDEPVAMVSSSQVYYYHYNHLGSIEAVTNNGGAVIERYSYEPYGKVSITGAAGTPLTESAIGNPFYFTAQVYDNETGLMNFRNRTYNPTLGRFMQRDPIGYVIPSSIIPSPLVGEGQGEGETGSTLNLYAYVENNPLNTKDPFGLRADWESDQPEGWNPYSSEVWEMSKPGANTPAWYPYVEGVIVGGPAAALTAAGGAAAIVSYGPTIVGSVSTTVSYGISQAQNIYRTAAPVVSNYASILNSAVLRSYQVVSNEAQQLYYNAAANYLRNAEVYNKVTQNVVSGLVTGLTGQTSGLPPQINNYRDLGYYILFQSVKYGSAELKKQFYYNPNVEKGAGVQNKNIGQQTHPKK